MTSLFSSFPPPVRVDALTLTFLLALLSLRLFSKYGLNEGTIVMGLKARLLLLMEGVN
jgi:hypothetical protein